MIYNITPVPAPRMTQRDKWAKRPCVMRYFTFRDEVKKLGVNVNESGDAIVFVMPMPNSWSKAKKKSYDGSPHQQKPDSDNLLKSLLDAIFKDDSHVWDVRISKIWGIKGQIVIKI